MEEPNTTEDIEFRPRAKRRRQRFPLARLAAADGPLARAGERAQRIRRQLVLAAAAFMGLLLFASLPGTASAHHATWNNATMACETGVWTVSANYVGGSGDRIVEVNLNSDSDDFNGAGWDSTETGVTGTASGPFRDADDEWHFDSVSGLNSFFTLSGPFSTLPATATASMWGVTHNESGDDGGAGAAWTKAGSADSYSTTIPTSIANPCKVWVCVYSAANGTYQNQEKYDWEQPDSQEGKCGTLVVDKITDPAASPESFNFTTNVPNFTTFNLTHAASPFSRNVPPGTYTVTENLSGPQLADGWALTSVSGCGTLQGAAVSVTVGSEQTKTCVFTNTEKPQLTIEKDCVGAEAGTFTISGAGSLGSQISCGGELSGTVNAGSYGITETQAPGWAAPAYTNCTGTIANGEEKTCTITNTKLPQIYVQKICATGSNPQGGFAFTIDHVGTDINDSVDCGTTDGPFTAGIGAYSVSEQVPSGWNTPTYGPQCSGTLAAGQVVTCVITNAQNSSTFTVQKVYVGGDGPAVTITLTCDGNGVISPATDTAAPGAPAVFTVTGMTVAETCTASEVLPDGYEITANSCDDGTVLNPNNDSKNCSITNSKLPILTIDKVCVGSQDGTFALGGTLPGQVPNSITCGDPIGPLTLPNNTAYDIEETVPSGWQAGSPQYQTCEGTLTYGQNVTCTITNVKLGSISATKDCEPDAPLGGPYTFTFELQTNAGAKVNVDNNPVTGVACGQTVTWTNVPPGDNYKVVETSALPEGWTKNESVCADIDLQPGETESACSITNTQPPTSITVTKMCIGPDGVTLPEGSFQITATGLTAQTIGCGGQAVFSNVVPGSYTIGENILDGSKYSRDAANALDTCPDGAVNLIAGQQYTCTIVNKVWGSVKVVKVCEPESIDGTLTEGFTFSIGAIETGVSIACGGESTTYYLPAGDYAVSEALSPSAEYTLKGIVCAGGGSSGATADVDNGDVIVCTITNTPYGEVIVLKNCLPEADNDDQFVFDLDGEEEFSPSTCNSEGVTLRVPADTYDLDETADDGNTYLYLSSSISGAGCSGSDGDFQVVVEAGKSITCTVTNDPMGIITALKECGDNVGTDLFTFILMLGDTVVESVSNVDCGQEVVFDDIPALANATYHVVEVIDSSAIGWSETSNDCDDLEPAVPEEVNEAAAECTIVNGLADPEVGKVANDADLSVAFGSQYTYTVEVMNTGDGPGDFLLEDYGLTGATIVSVTESENNVTCNYSVGGTSFDCTVTELAGGASIQVTVTVLANSTCEPVNNSARVFFLETEGEGEPEDNVQAQQVEVTGCSFDIELGKGQRIGNSGAFTTSTLDVGEGTNVQYRIVIENTGNQPLSNVTIDDPIPGDLTLLTIVSDPDNRCDIVAGDLVCDGFDLDPNEDYVVIIEVEVEDCDLITNRAFGDTTQTTEQPSNAVQLVCEEEELVETPTPTPTPTTTVSEVAGTQTQPQQPQEPRISQVLPSRLPATGTGDSIESGSGMRDFLLWGGIALALMLLGLGFMARSLAVRRR